LTDIQNIPEQAGLDRVGDDHDGAGLVEQLVRDGLLGDVLDVGQHAYRIAGALVFLRAGEGRGSHQGGREQDQTGKTTHGRLR
jgi:hypothetical protein